jgi:hypothetical protein
MPSLAMIPETKFEIRRRVTMHKASQDKVLLAAPHSLHRGTCPKESNTAMVRVAMRGARSRPLSRVTPPLKNKCDHDAFGHATSHKQQCYLSDRLK